MNFTKKIVSRLIILYKYEIMDVLYNNYYIHGKKARVHIGKSVSLVNTILNTSSGEIFIGDNTIFGHNCMILTGVHEFVGGMRKRLVAGGSESPSSGYDINIGSGCWITSGVIIIGKVSIGNNTIIGAGSVVTHDIPSGVFAAGIPAKVIKILE